jgi:calcineurin-like phosphoesterase family protein
MKRHQPPANPARFSNLDGRKHLLIGNHDDEAGIARPLVSTKYMAEFQDRDQSRALCRYPPLRAEPRNGP